MAAKKAQKKKPERKDAYITRYAFVDAGYTPGEDFAHRLIASGEFALPDIKGLHPAAKSKNDKRDAAYEVANALIQKRVRANDVFRAFCKKDRHWLAFRLGSTGDHRPQLGTSRDFLTRFGDAGWYGPVMDDETALYVYAREVKHYEPPPSSDEEPKPYRVRWHVIARVNPDYVSFQWNGFTHLDDPEAATQGRRNLGQFAYWYYMPEVIKSLEDELNIELEPPSLHTAVLRSIWDEFIGEDDHTWNHRRIRAEKEGVALNARSSGVKELNVKGIEALTNALAKTAIETLLGSKGDAKTLKRVGNALLRTLIHKWGTKSYEFSLDRGEKKVFRGHCYFGGKPNLEGPDQFAHVRCYDNYGGATGALEFLMPYLIEE